MEKYKRFNDGVVFKFDYFRKTNYPIYTLYFVYTVNQLIQKINCSIFEDKNDATVIMLQNILFQNCEVVVGGVGSHLIIHTLYNYLDRIQVNNLPYSGFDSEYLLPLMYQNKAVALYILLKIATRSDLTKKLIWALKPEDDFVIECPICFMYYLNDERYFTPTKCSQGHKLCNFCTEKWFSPQSSSWVGSWFEEKLRLFYNKKIVDYIKLHAGYLFFEGERHKQCLICLERVS